MHKKKMVMCCYVYMSLVHILCDSYDGMLYSYESEVKLVVGGLGCD